MTGNCTEEVLLNMEDAIFLSAERLGCPSFDEATTLSPLCRNSREGVDRKRRQGDDKCRRTDDRAEVSHD